MPRLKFTPDGKVLAAPEASKPTPQPRPQTSSMNDPYSKIAFGQHLSQSQTTTPDATTEEPTSTPTQTTDDEFSDEFDIPAFLRQNKK